MSSLATMHTSDLGFMCSGPTPPACLPTCIFPGSSHCDCWPVACSMGNVPGGLRRKEGRGSKVTEAARMGVGRGLGSICRIEGGSAATQLLWEKKVR